MFLEGEKTKAGRGDDELRQAAVPGGKGMGGKWLFVSHDPVEIPVRDNGEDVPITTLFELVHQQSDVQNVPGPEARFVKFQFEPMVGLNRLPYIIQRGIQNAEG